MFKPCVVIPVYNHERAIGRMLKEILAQKLPCILVDDGSGPECAAVLDRLAAASAKEVTLLRHVVNRGKGGAVLTAIRYAAQQGYSHALQIDADGQHCVSDIPRFLEQASADPAALIAGSPRYDATAPWLRLYARALTHFWVSINTLSRRAGDSMCGFRVYPIPAVIAIDQRHKLSERMNFDIEVLVRLYWAGVKVISVGTPVAYPVDGVSHFRTWLDSVLISFVHARLFFGMVRRLPMLLARRWSTP
jgi:glycosyltransferase involved in cell wall biosynthesis